MAARSWPSEYSATAESTITGGTTRRTCHRRLAFPPRLTVRPAWNIDRSIARGPAAGLRPAAGGWRLAAGGVVTLSRWWAVGRQFVYRVQTPV
jgi:hypothetical protein